MSESLSKFQEWFDSDFFKLGAFLTSSDGQHVLFAKGGVTELSHELLVREKTSFYLKDFYQDTYLAYHPREILSIPKDEVPFLQVEHSHFSPLSNDDDLYEKDFATLEAAFKQGLKKIVLISRETFGSFEGEKTIRHLFNRAFTFGTGLPYGIWDKTRGMIGSTPELLLNIEHTELKTYALAGTARRGEESELLTSRKDRHEHQLVVDDIREKLSPFSTNISTQETKVHSFKDLIHLRTDIEASLRHEVRLTDLVNSLSPTAALGGLPKRESLDLLKNSYYSQEHPERFFGSAFGVLEKEKKEFVVAIRSVQWERSHLFIECGGGIVPESEFEKELAEVHLKRDIVRKHYL